MAVPPWPVVADAGPALALNGEWQVEFVAGGPELPTSLRTPALRSWTELGGEATQRFAGTARYRIEFEAPAQPAADWRRDLGDVRESAAAYVAAKLIEERAHLAVFDPKVKRAAMLEALETIAAFAPGNGDVCEIIARRARAARCRSVPAFPCSTGSACPCESPRTAARSASRAPNSRATARPTTAGWRSPAASTM